MLKCTLNLAPWLIRTKKLNFEGDELAVVGCTVFPLIVVQVNSDGIIHYKCSKTCILRPSVIYNPNHWNQRVVVKHMFKCTVKPKLVVNERWALSRNVKFNIKTDDFQQHENTAN